MCAVNKMYKVHSFHKLNKFLLRTYSVPGAMQRESKEGGGAYMIHGEDRCVNYELQSTAGAWWDGAIMGDGLSSCP